MGTVSEGPKVERFEFIANHRATFGIRYLCDRLDVSPAGFYVWRNREPSARDRENMRLLDRIKKLFTEHDGNYGSPRIHQTLRSTGQRVNLKRVERLMREEGLVGKAARLYRREKLPENSCIEVPNLRFDQDAPVSINQHWAGDVTYLKVNGQWQYLAVIMDLYSRRIVGWSLDNTRTAELTLAALSSAMKGRHLKPDMIFHSDRGAEYGAHSYQEKLRDNGIEPSMNRPKTMTDNIHVESFFRTLKTECFHGLHFDSVSELRMMFKWYIDKYYNTKRIHSSLGFKTPHDYERMAA